MKALTALFAACFCASVAHAEPRPAICAPVNEILDAIAAAAPVIGGGKLNVFDGKDAQAFAAAAEEIIGAPSDMVSIVVTLLPDNPKLFLAVTYISEASCVVGSGRATLEQWNEARLTAGMNPLKRPQPGLGI
jgi:hypothetical protein